MHKLSGPAAPPSKQSASFSLSVIPEVHLESNFFRSLYLCSMTREPLMLVFKHAGFEISETAFLVFLLMASRRLQADRFFTEHYNEKVYGKAGFDWIRSTRSLRDILKRHYPELEKELPPNVSCFTPYSPYPTRATTH